MQREFSPSLLFVLSFVSVFLFLNELMALSTTQYDVVLSAWSLGCLAMLPQGAIVLAMRDVFFDRPKPVGRWAMVRRFLLIPAFAGFLITTVPEYARSVYSIHKQCRSQPLKECGDPLYRASAYPWQFWGVVFRPGLQTLKAVFEKL